MSNVRLEKLRPATTFLFGSSYFQRKAASTRNKTVDAIDADQTSEVIYRYLQARANQKIAATQLSVMLGIDILEYFFFFDQMVGSKLSLALNIASAWLQTCVLGTIIDFGDTAKGCEKWLTAKLGKDTVNLISKLPFTSAGVSAAAQLVQEKVNANYLSQKAHHMYLKP